MNFHCTLAPGASKGIDVVGDFFSVAFANADVMIRLNLTNGENREEAIFSQGDSVELKTGKFRRLQVRNPSVTATVQVIIYAGEDRYEQRRQSTMETPTEILSAPLALNQIPAGGSVTLSGIASGNRIRRKSVVVSNMDPVNELLIRDVAGNAGAAAFARQSTMLPISGEVIIANITAAPIVCYISEIWYVVP